MTLLKQLRAQSKRLHTDKHLERSWIRSMVFLKRKNIYLMDKKISKQEFVKWTPN